MGFTAPEKLSIQHDFSEFDCGYKPITNFARNKALKSQTDGNCSVYVLCETGSNIVRAFFTLSSAVLIRKELPESTFKNSYKNIPATLLGQLAVDHRYQGQGLGLDLLRDAISIAIVSAKDIASRALLVDAIPEAAEFYKKHGFAPCLGPEENKFYISLNASELSLLLDTAPKTPPR
jgi:GNAT superfamily N-acetyltransferase